MIHNYELDKIYFNQTREYFKEVVSSYSNENYRSANVMLYSIAISDILLKIKELSDQDDKKASEILNKLSKEKDFRYTENSIWENKLIESVRNETKLLDNQAYINLCYLKDIRNLAAHPSLDEDYALIMPTKEITLANINNIYSEILVKSPIYISNITKKY